MQTQVPWWIWYLTATEEDRGSANHSYLKSVLVTASNLKAKYCFCLQFQAKLKLKYLILKLLMSQFLI